MTRVYNYIYIYIYIYMYICICTYVTVCPDIYWYVFELLPKPVKYLSKLLRQQLCKASTRMNKQKSRVTKKNDGKTLPEGWNNTISRVQFPCIICTEAKDLKISALSSATQMPDCENSSVIVTAFAQLEHIKYTTMPI